MRRNWPLIYFLHKTCLILFIFWVGLAYLTAFKSQSVLVSLDCILDFIGVYVEGVSEMFCMEEEKGEKEVDIKLMTVLRIRSI